MKTLVYAENASETERFACEELQKYIALAAGETLPAASEKVFESSGSAGAMFVGRTEAGKRFANRFPELKNDGFALFSADENIYIFAETPRGALYGAYRYLEEGYGIRFFDMDAEEVPPKPHLIPNVDRTVVPPFRYAANLTDLTYHTHEGRDSEKMTAWYAKTCSTHEFIYCNAQTDSGKTEAFFRAVERAGGGIELDVSINPTHNNLVYVDPNVYFTEENRERNRHMFCFGGSRKYDPEGPVSDINYADGIKKDGSIDHSTVNAASVYVESLKKQMLAHPDRKYFTCGQQDITYCHPDCGKTDVETSYTVLRFYNAVAKEIKRWQQACAGAPKQAKLVIFSYYFTKVAPVEKTENGYKPIDDSVVLCDNVVVRFADIVSNQTLPFTDEDNAAFGYGPDYLEKWAPVVKNCSIWYWGYVANHTFYYFYLPVIRKVKPVLYALRRANAEYVMLQANTTEAKDWKTVLENYVFGKLLREPDADPYALREEFIQGYYGIAAKAIGDSVEDLERTVETLNRTLVWEGHKQAFWAQIYRLYPNSHIKSDVVTELMDKEFLMAKACERMLNRTAEAIRSIENSSLGEQEKQKYADRVALTRLTPLFTLCFYREFLYGGAHFETESYPDNAAAYRLVKQEFFDLCDRFGVREYGERLKIRGAAANTAESMFSDAEG